MLTRRELARETTVREIKDIAITQMRARGDADIRFADIAREMRMSAPGLYRYFAGRDELMTALLVDAFSDLAVALETARDAVDPDDVGARLLALTSAFRRWAKEDPLRFAMMFGLPVPGYSAPHDGPTTEAAKRAMAALKSLAWDAQRTGTLAAPRLTVVSGALDACFVEMRHEGDPSLPPATMQALMHLWAVLQGFVTLEAFTHLMMLDDAGRDALFVSNVRLAAEAAGLPAPRAGWPTG